MDVEGILQKHFAAATANMRDTRAALDILSQQLGDAFAQISALESRAEPPYVRNNLTRKMHRVGEVGTYDPRLWTTSCGITFVAQGSYSRLDSLLVDAQPENQCARCFG